MAAAIEMIGKKCGRLLVISRAVSRRDIAYWNCICDCGKETIASGYDLRSGDKKSCGCYVLEVLKNQGYRNRIHGFSRYRIYNIYIHMKSRCLNQENKVYNDYGGRGITVCKDWADDFDTFLNDMGESYEIHCALHGIRNTTIDRIENDKGYSKDNCRWATYKVQASNKRKSRPKSKAEVIADA